MAHKSILVRIDDRIRLMSALLAVTDYPEKAHQRKGHRPHAHARATTKALQEYKNHPAVMQTQYLLNKNAPLEALYSYVLRLAWPTLTIAENPAWIPQNWNQYMLEFYETVKLTDIWQQDAAQWEKAQLEAASVLKDVDVYDFLRPFFGDVSEQLVFMPNISYPSDVSVGARIENDLMAVVPPRIAWGDNPPWPFTEDKAHVFSNSLTEYVRLLMLAYLRQNAKLIDPVTQKDLPVSDDFKTRFPTWGEQFTWLFVGGVVALFLESRINQQEAQAYILMEKKAKGVSILPGVVSVLKRYLNEYEGGKYKEFTEFLPHFPGHLRIAKTITSL